MKEKIISILGILLFAVTLCACDKEKLADNYNHYKLSEDVFDTQSDRIWIEDYNGKNLLLTEGVISAHGTEIDYVEYNNYMLENNALLVVPNGFSTAYSCTTVQYGFNDTLIRCDLENGLLSIFDNDNNLIKECYVSEIGLKKSEDVFADGSYIYDMAVDNEYIYFFDWEGNLWILDYDLQVVDEMMSLYESDSEESTVPQFVKNIQNNCLIYSGIGDALYSYQKGELVKESGKSFKGLGEYINEYEFVRGDANYDYYIKKCSLDMPEDSWLLGVKDGQISKMLNFNDLGLLGVYGNVENDFDGGFFFLDSYRGDYKLYHIIPDENAISKQESRTEIEIAGVGISNEMKSLVIDYNRNQNNYHVTLNDYCEGEKTFDDAVNDLDLDIVRGKSPDGILLYDMNKDKLISNGVLEDLSGYISDSSNISEDKITNNVWDSFFDEEGHVYSVFPDYKLEGFASGEKIDLHDVSKIDNSLGNKTLFADQFMFTILPDIIRYSGTEIVDGETKEVKVDTEEFKNLLISIKKQSDIQGENYYISGQQRIAEKTAETMYVSIGCPYEYMFYREIFGGDFYCTNLGCDAPVIVPGDSEIGVISSSNNKEGMEDFIEYMFEEKNSRTFFGEKKMPSLNSSLDWWNERMTTDGEYIDKYGYNVRGGYYSIGFEDFSVKLGVVSDEDIESMNNFIASAIRLEEMKPEYMDIISEEGPKYIDGEMDMDTVIGYMQNRLKTAVNE